MNPYKSLDGNPHILRGDLEKQITNIVQNLTHISLCYDDIENQFFDMGKVSVIEELIDIIYKKYSDGLLNLYGCFVHSNIREQNLNTYADNIIDNEGLSDSDYYRGKDTFDKINKLMAYFDGREGKSNIQGYSIDSEKYPNFKVSKNIGEYFMVLGFTAVKYLNRAMEIINNEEDEDKSTGQALLIEALFIWIKIGNCLRININEVIAKL